MKTNETTRSISMVIRHTGMVTALMGILMTGSAFGASSGPSPANPAATGTTPPSPTISMGTDMSADKKDIVLDQKASARLQVDILRNRLALQKARARMDEIQDKLAKLRSDRNGVADRETIGDLRSRLKKEQKTVSVLERELRIDRAEKKALMEDIAKNKQEFKSDVAGQKKTSAANPVHVPPVNPPAPPPGVASSGSSSKVGSKTTGSAGNGASTKTASSSVSAKSSSVSAKNDLVADKKDIVFDQKMSRHLRMDILRNRLTLQEALAKEDKTRDRLQKLQSDLRSNMKDKDDHKADILSDRKEILSLQADLKNEQKSIVSMRSEIKKDVAERKSVLADIVKNTQDVKADVEERDLARDRKSVKALESKISGYRHTLAMDRHRFREVLENAEDGDAKGASLQAAIKSLKTKLSSAEKSLRVARMDLRKDVRHHVGTASTLRSSSVNLAAKSHPMVHPIVHPEDKK